MKRILEQLRGVVGVTGVSILDRYTGMTNSLFSARFSEPKKEELERMLQRMVSAVQTTSAFKIRFESGWLMIKSDEDYAVLILARDDLNFETLKLVMKSGLVSLRSVSVASAPARKTQQLTPASISILIEAFNSISEYLMTASEIGPYGTSALLRKAREDILDHFPTLKKFAVDNNGKVELIRSADKNLDSDVVEAIAWWSLTFRDKVNSKKPVFGLDIKTITKKHNEELDSLGFYTAYRHASSQPVRG
ncbi:MAG: hypothetical protein KKG33_03560 [candidate division Zixibacteria bacterium]|nr:hypothetical protein [candidate division Zixibacteria bacterium]MBU1469093.1 hypothetical protein [candidate division Zixibacteria bacterium]MBU2624621.1 hypothetical protein [candidate division Zixibacteria bacterium]